MRDAFEVGLSWAVLVMSSVVLMSCSDLVEDTLLLGTEPPQALAEADLPNCSRVVNCCSRLSQSPYTAVVPESVQGSCTDTFGLAADGAIDQYQNAKGAVENQGGINETRRAELLTDLRDEWQGRVEPGCRCFLEETVGTLPDIALPQDCDSVTTTGVLSGGATCDDGITAVLDTAAGGN